MQGKTTQWSEHSPLLTIIFDEPLKGGTSGGPVVNASGELVGIISNSFLVNGGTASRPHLALPVWVYRNYFEPSGD